MNGAKIEKQLVYLFFAILFLLQLYLILFNGRTFGGADNVSHFQIARFAFKYPHLFLDHWGKPVYTALLAPFAQFGFSFGKLFNLFAAIITLFFLYKISRTFYSKGGIYVVLFAAFAPVYFQLMATCLTEILFSLVLVISVYLFIKNKYILSAIVLSFIPFVRNEGIILFFIFMLAYGIKRSFISIVFLSTGAFFYSIIGYFVFDDFFWIINRFPHSVEDNIYGSGELLHFVKNSKLIFGMPLIAVAMFGLIIWIIQVFKNFRFKNDNVILFIIVAGSWIAYFSAHSFVWWQGISSLGLIRVIGGVIPLVALTAIIGFQFLFERVQNKNLVHIALFILVCVQLFLLVQRTEIPLKAGPADKLIEESTEYLKGEETNGRIFYFNPEFVFHLGFDPYDVNLSNWGIGDKEQPSNSLEFGDILIWDAHFGPNEGGVDLNSLENDPFLERIEAFYPIEKIIVLGGHDYSIQIFRKTANKSNAQPSSTELERNLDFKNNTNKQVVEIDGVRGWKLDNTQEFSPSIVIQAKEFDQNNVLDFTMSVNYTGLEKINADEVLLILSIENDTEHLRYEKVDILCANPNGWESIDFKFRIPAALPKNAKISFYIWNKDKKQLAFNDLRISIKSS